MPAYVQKMYMGFLSQDEREFAAVVGQLAYANPFLPERIDLERRALGTDFVDSPPVWSVRLERGDQNPNLERLGARVERLAFDLRGRLGNGALGSISDDDRRLYEDLAVYALYHRHEEALWDFIEARKRHDAPVACYDAFCRDAEALLDVPDLALGTRPDTAHLFACLYQVRRAFHHIFRYIIGGSMAMARLRAAAWQSIFTHDVRRYQRALYDRMGDVTTLVVGASGTGKEVVARAIALSRFIPFDSKSRRFAEDFTALFHPLNLSALAPTLIESELFGHRRGAFTGALQDRAGWLEQCSMFGTVFLDEIGDVDAGIQVKLLRVLQSRTFERLGDTQPREFRGKIIAATNRDIPKEIHAGRFRQDFYYRLCADIIRTPSLAEQLRESTGELENLLLFIARRIVGDVEAERLAHEVTTWIDVHLGPHYGWPGNVRELEQCVRNVLVRGEYQPLELMPSGARAALLEAVARGALSAEELLNRYCALVYAETGSYQETARRLGIDRRTVRSRIDARQVEAFRG